MCKVCLQSRAIHFQKLNYPQVKLYEMCEFVAQCEQKTPPGPANAHPPEIADLWEGFPDKDIVVSTEFQKKV